MILTMLKHKSAFYVAMAGSIIYFFFHLYIIGDLSFDYIIFKNFMFLENWKELIFQTKSAFQWEAIGMISLKGITFFLSPINILIALLMSLLVFLNTMVVIYSIFLKRIKKMSKKYNFIIIIFPSLIAGLSCFYPALILIFSHFSNNLNFKSIYAKEFLIPLSFILMTFSVSWGISKIKKYLKN